MTTLFSQISVSLDGYVAGPNPTLDDPLGEHGMDLHEWVIGLDAWRKVHGHEGGERTRDSELVEEWTARTGAVVMGRKMFSGGSGPWADDPNARGWWGDDPPFGVPVFVLTHHKRELLAMGDTDFNFVTDGPEAALERAREAAGDRDVLVAGGAEAIREYLDLGAIEELELSVVPVMLGNGTRLFDGADYATGFEIDRVVASPSVTHLRYRTTK